MNREKHLYVAQSSKNVKKFAEDFKKVAENYNFIIHNSTTMDMSKTFADHGADVPDDFDLHMIHVCKPAKSSVSLVTNPERAIFMPKFIMAFSKDSKTEIRYLSYGEEHIRELVVEDDTLPSSLNQTFVKIRSMIDEAR